MSEMIVGYMYWKKKPGVTLYTLCDSQFVTGKEAKTRMWSGQQNTNWQKINDSILNKEVQFAFTEGFGGRAEIMDVQVIK